MDTGYPAITCGLPGADGIGRRAINPHAIAKRCIQAPSRTVRPAPNITRIDRSG